MKAYDRMDYYRKNVKRAETIYAREEERGRTDRSAAQAYRVYLASEAVRSWHGRMARAKAEQVNKSTYTPAKKTPKGWRRATFTYRPIEERK